MFKTSFALIFTLLTTVTLLSQSDQASKPALSDKDWLIESPEIESVVYQDDKEVILSNGLISRTIRITPNAATVGLKNLRTGEEFIRSVKPEAMLSIDGRSYPIGGLSGQKEHGYLKWERKGKEAIFHYTHPGLKGILVEVHYEIYDGLPLLGKWIVVKNTGSFSVRIDHFTGEIIAHPEKNNYVDELTRWDLPNLYLENDYAFGGFTYVESPNAIHWELDPEYSSQVRVSIPAHGYLPIIIQ